VEGGIAGTGTHEAVAERSGAGGSRARAIAMVLAGAVAWGLSGTAAQALFQHHGFQPAWLVTVRMLASGILLLLWVAVRQGPRYLYEVWTAPGHWWRLLVFGILGLVGVQYTYFRAIQEGNAATATLLQYLGPVMLTVWMALAARRWPPARQVAAAGLALAGTWLLIAGGSLHTLRVPAGAVGMGLASAVLLAFYTIFPAKLIAREGPLVVVGSGMLAGGLACLLVAPPWQTAGMAFGTTSLGLTAFVVIPGTMMAFTLYLAAARTLTPQAASVLASAEPLAATLAAVLWLHTSWTLAESVGGLLIVATVILLARA
jgi:drug/metabolite transporter (DMT)-like permease